MLKFAIPIILFFLTILFNKIQKTIEQPDVWSIGIFTPIFKSSEVDNPDNYQGITTTGCLSKLLCKLLSCLSKIFNS